jgi:PAS domain S-box-containing protein
MGDFVPAKLDRTGKAVANVLEAAPDAMVVMGTDGRIVRVNIQTEKMFEYSEEGVGGSKT